MWEPQDGFQVDFLDCRYCVDECFGGGNRGGGKTDGLIMDFNADAVQWGSAWKGILFRRTFSQFRQIIDRSKELFYELYSGDAVYKEGTLKWILPTGSVLQFFHMAEDSDAEKHLGLQYPWIGFDELPHWPTAGPYKRLKATNRSATRGIPKRIRSTGNPGGPGLAWIKNYFEIPDDPNHPGGDIIKKYDEDTKTTRTRMFLRSILYENKALLEADPGYPATVREACEGNEQLELAWLQGNFNVFFGKFFTMFDPQIHCLSPTDLFADGIVPDDWRLYGSLDYGENDFTSFGLWAYGKHPQIGDISYRVGEWYGRGLWLSEYAGRIHDLVSNHPVTAGRIPERVFADPSIFYTRADAATNPMDRMVSDVFRRDAKLKLEPANKNRVAGWRHLKEQLSWRRNSNGDLVKWPKLFYSPECSNFERCMMNAVYAGDEDNPKEDMNTRQEDHPCDDGRYFVMGAVAPRQYLSDNRTPFQTMGDIKRRIINPELRREGFYIPDPGYPDLDEQIQELAI